MEGVWSIILLTFLSTIHFASSEAKLNMFTISDYVCACQFLLCNISVQYLGTWNNNHLFVHNSVGQPGGSSSFERPASTLLVWG